MAKAAFNKMKTLFTSTLDLNLRKNLEKNVTFGVELCVVLKLGSFGQ